MWKTLLERVRQGHRTMAWPDGPAPPMPERYRGAPAIDRERCEPGCAACADACPTECIELPWAPRPGAGGGPGARGAAAPGGEGSGRAEPRVDLGRCLFCTDCTDACPTGAIAHGKDPRLASRTRDGLWTAAAPLAAPPVASGAGPRSAIGRGLALEASLLRLFGRSLKLREVSAGGCNACEADTNVLGTVGWDLGRFGVQFVASPRHADGLLITGPVSANMELALRKTWDAIPAPKLVIAVGACAIAGGPFRGHGQVLDGAGGILPVDLYVPGCPPHPFTILEALVGLLGRG